MISVKGGNAVLLSVFFLIILFNWTVTIGKVLRVVMLFAILDFNRL